MDREQKTGKSVCYYQDVWNSRQEADGAVVCRRPLLQTGIFE